MLKDRQELVLAKITTLLVGFLSVIFAVSITSILDILICAYTFWAPIIVIPLGAVLLGAKAGRESFLAGAIAGIAGVLLWNNLPGTPAEVDGLIVGVLANALVFTLSYKLRDSRQ